MTTIPPLPNPSFIIPPQVYIPYVIGITLIIFLNYYKGRVIDKSLFVLGFFPFLFSITSILLPFITDLKVFIVYWVGNLSYFTAGICLMIGCANCKMKLIKIGLYFIAYASFVLILSNIYGIFWHFSTKSAVETEYLLMLWMMRQNPPDPNNTIPTIHVPLPTTPNIEIHYYTAHILLMILGLILGSIALIVMKKRETPTMNKTNCERTKSCESCENFMKKTPIEMQPIHKFNDTCSYCNQIIKYPSNFCTHCGCKLLFCEICKHLIKEGEEISTCPFCDSQFHEREFFEWLKTKSCCPACHKELDLWDFQKIKEKEKNNPPKIKKIEIKNEHSHIIIHLN